MADRETSDLVEAIKLIKRWDEVDVPEYVWSDPMGDYHLPMDTKEFLLKLKED